MNKPTLRHSQIQDYQKCPGCYEVKWLLGVRTQASSKMSIGTAVDAVQNFNLTQKITTGTDISSEQAGDMAATEVEKLKADTDWEGEFDQSKDVAVQVAQFLITEVSPLIKPVAVQLSFKIETDLPFDIAGTIDYIDADGRVRDLKVTSKSGLNYYQIENGLQSAAYWFAQEALTGKTPTSFVFDCVLRPDSKNKISYKPLEGIVSKDSINHFWKCAVHAHKGIQAGSFMPAWSAAWWCDGLCKKVA